MMLSVIIVEDEAHYLNELMTILGREPEVHIARACQSAKEVMTVLNGEKTDLIFIDLSLPGVNGLELADGIRKIRKEIFIVLMSEDRSFALDSYDIGVSDFLLKPFKEKRVRETLKRASLNYGK